MNERIRELSKQAWESVSVQDALNDEAFEQYDKKFAELIVRECAEVADKEYNVPGCGYITKTKGMRIREHFGVEE